MGLMKDEFIVEAYLEENPSTIEGSEDTYELTIQQLVGVKEKKGWSNDEFWDKVDREMAFEMERLNEVARQEKWD